MKFYDSEIYGKLQMPETFGELLNIVQIHAKDRNIAISPDFKEKMKVILSEYFDIRHLTLFPDIDGFGYANSFRFSQYESERW